jgi:hypothetical protein
MATSVLSTIPDAENQQAATVSQPDGMQSQITAPSDGNINKDIPEIVKNWLKKQTEKFLSQDKFARRAEVMEARRQRFYDRGDQYIWWNNSAMVFVPITGGASVAVGSDSVDMPRYTDVYNIFHGYLRSIVALLSQNPPGVNFEPDDMSKSADITAQQAAEKFKYVIDRANNRRALQADIARMFCTDARCVLYTRTVKNAQKFGKDENGEAKSGQLIDAFGVLESKVPLTAKDQDAYHYLVISDEIDIVPAKAEYKDFASKIQEGSSSMGESAYERFARLGVLQGTSLLFQTGDAYAHIVTRHRVWMRPSCFEGAPEAVKSQLQELFPDGAHIVFCGDTYCGSWNECMDDHIAVDFPQPGDGQNRMSWMKPMVPIQDAYNDYKNMRKEYHDYGIPVTAWNSDAIDVTAFHEQVSEPGNNLQITVTPNMSAKDMFAQTAALQPPGDLVEAEIDLRESLSQFVTAVFPALAGGSTGSNDTASGIAIQRDQAMGNMGLPWGGIQNLYARAYKQAVMCAAEEAEDEDVVSIAIPRKGNSPKAEQLALGDLKKGNFRCVPDTDSSFPETWSARKNAVVQFFQAAIENPVLLEAANQPDNLELAREYSGLDDLVIPGAESRNKQLREIEQLLQEKPVPPSQQELQQAALQHAAAATQAQMTGQGPPPPPNPATMVKPSIEVDPIFDFHKYEFEKCQEWLNSEERVAQEKVGNLAGIMNVRLHGLEHFKLMATQQMPPPGTPQNAPSPTMPAPAQPQPTPLM